MVNKKIEMAWRDKCKAYNIYKKMLRIYGPLLDITARKWKTYIKARKYWEGLCNEKND